MSSNSPAAPAALDPANEAILKERWPHILQVLNDITPDEEIVLTTQTPLPTLIIKGLQLSSVYDQTSEARLQASRVPMDAAEVCVYGLGLGALVRELLTRGRINTLHVVIMAPQIEYWTLAHFNHSDWLQDPRVQLHLARDEQNIRMPFAFVPPCLQLAEDGATPLKDMIAIEVNRESLNSHFSHALQQFHLNIETNKPFMQDDHDVAELFNSKVGARAVIVAGGPTAQAQFDWIKEQREQLTVIAVNTALIPLQKAGIKPDFAVVCEYQANTIDHFTDLNKQVWSDVPLVYVASVHHDVVACWQGPRYVALHHQAIFQNLREPWQRGYLFSSGTVTHDAVDLAVQMGAKQVCLAGADFSFPNNKSHMDNVTFTMELENYANTWAIDGYGQRVKSAQSLVMYLRELERYITLHPGVEFINTGKAGANIAGTTWKDE